MDLKRKNLRKDYIIDFNNGCSSQSHKLYVINSLVKANGVSIFLDREDIIKNPIENHPHFSKNKIKEILGAFEENSLVGI